MVRLPGIWRRRLNSLRRASGAVACTAMTPRCFRWWRIFFPALANPWWWRRRVQQVINRCEIPMLKMALKKPLILEQENHPIRRLFNEMAKYAIGLEQGDCEDNKIYQQMVKMSETMLDDSFDEQRLPQIFSEFMSLLDRDRRMTAMAEEKRSRTSCSAGKNQLGADSGGRGNWQAYGRQGAPSGGDRFCSAQLVCGAAYGASAQWRIRRRLAGGA